MFQRKGNPCKLYIPFCFMFQIVEFMSLLDAFNKINTLSDLKAVQHCNNDIVLPKSCINTFKSDLEDILRKQQVIFGDNFHL